MSGLSQEDLLATLIGTVPADDDRGTYSKRNLQADWVKEKHKSESHDGGSMTGESGWGCGVSQEVFDALEVGEPFVQETQGFSLITGWVIKGKWYDRKTDEDLAAEHKAFVENIKRERQETLAANRERWQSEEDLLPAWLRDRLRTFHEKGGDDFALDGWGYELMICQLAEEYYLLGDVILDKDIFQISEYESEKLKQMAREFGTSGNQHSVALALAREHRRHPDTSLAGTVSALTPLTGDPFYENGD